MPAIYFEQVCRVLTEEHGWFQPNMESKRYILDNRLTNYPYIVVRVITDINKETGYISDGFHANAKVFAINLKTKSGWVKTRNIKYYSNWNDYLLSVCRTVWKEAVLRAKKKNLKRMTIEEYEADIVLS